MRFYTNRYLGNLRAAGLCRDCKQPSERYRCFKCRRKHAAEQAQRDARKEVHRG